MRKTAIVKIEDEGRDKGKIFIIREMPAAIAERWATRALLALARSGVDLPENVTGAGWAGIAAVGFKALSSIEYHDIQPLLDEMWLCVTVRPDNRNPEVTRPLVLDGEGADVEEVATLLKLRTEVFNLHAGFSTGGAPSTAPILTTSPQTPVASQNTETLQHSTAAPSARRFPPGKRR